MWRKPGRTILIFLQVMVASALFGVLQGLKTGAEVASANARADLLIVLPAVSGGAPLPRAALEHLSALPDVRYVTFDGSLAGTYQNPDQPVYVSAIEKNPVWLTMIPEFLEVQKEDL